MENIRKEILEAINKIAIDCSDFEHCLEDSKFTHASHIYSIESENYLIELDLQECVLWHSYDDNEFYDLEINGIEVINIEGEDIDIDFITDEEILDAINY